MTVGLGKNFATPWLARPSAALDVRPASRPLSRIVVRRGHRVLSPVRPNAGIEAVYAARLAALLRDVDASVRYWVGSAYRRAEPQLDLLIGSMAADAATADLEKVLRALRRRWEPKFNQLARDLAQYFVTKAADRSDAELKKLLKRAGFTVEFKLTAPVREVMRATVAENVSLIRSIPQQYLTRVEGAVMRSVVAGRDLKSLTDELADSYDVSRRRAELIARDQNAKATGAIQKIRYLEIGVERAIWMHSHAGREPRPSHLANDGKEYDVRTGWYDPDEGKFIFPGWLINCRCSSRPILP